MPDDGLGLELPTVVDAESVALSVGEETLVASAVQIASCCDVWFRVPSTWSNVVLRLYGRVGAARALLRQVTLANAPSLVEAGMTTGIALTIRGRPVTAFELTCQSPELAVTDGALYLSVWHSPADLHSSGGGDVPEAATSSPQVTATLLARDGDTGELRAITTDSAGRLLMANPTFSGSDQAKLDNATDAATPSTLASRDGSGASRFTGILTSSVDHDTPSPGLLQLGTGAGSTGVTVGKATGTTTIWNPTFEGTTTVVDSTSLQVSDRVITVNRTAGPSAPVPSQITGISVMRGDVVGAKRDFVGAFWDESAQAFRLAFNTGGDDATLGSAVPLVASEFRGPTGAASVLRADTLTDAIQLKAGTTTVLAVSDSSGVTRVEAGDRALAVGTKLASAGAGHSLTLQAQQGIAGSVGGDLSIIAGKGGTPGTNPSGSIVFENGQLVSSTSSLNRWQSGGSDYLTLQQTSVGPTFATPDGAQLIMKASGAGTTLNANTGNLSLFGNTLGTLYAASLMLGGSGISWEDVALNRTLVWTNVRTNWAWTFDAAVTNPTFTQAQATAGAGQPIAIKSQQGQNVVGGANANGGDVRIASGAAGTGGTGGLPGLVYLSLGADDTLKVSRVSSSNQLDFANTFAATVSIAADATAAVTGKALTIKGAPVTGTGAATGGSVAIVGGDGTGGGGGIVQIVGGQSTSGNGSGGEVDIVGGSKSGTGKLGNISLHTKTPSFQNAEAVLYVGNVATEPTGAPSAGGFLWCRTDGQLTHQGVNGTVTEYPFTGVDDVQRTNSHT